MSRRRSQRAGTRDKLLDLGLRTLLPGLAFMLFAFMFGSHPILKGAAKVLLPLGGFLTFVGILLLFVRRLPDGLPHLSRQEPRFPVQPAEPAYRGDPVTRQVLDHRVSLPQLAVRSESPGPEAPTRWNADVFEMIEWRRFEAVVERLFQQAGFETKSQSHGADMGIDVWLYSKHAPGHPVGLVQCKHWAGKRVGVDKVRELRGVMASQSVERGQFATTSSFTDDAIDFARANKINLLDKPRLLALIAERTEAQRAELLEVALQGEYWVPTCASCGIKLVRRDPKGGGRPFWGCVNFASPRRCRTKMEIRASLR